MVFECAHCGTFVCEGCEGKNQCSECHEDFCNECFEECHGCTEVFCTTCADPGSHACDGDDSEDDLDGE